MVPVLVLICILPGAIDAALRVFGGKDVDPQEYPYVVSIEMKTMLYKLDTYLLFFSHMCTASVLTPIWTLTAGHCINFKQYTSSMRALMSTATIKYVIRYGSITTYNSSSDSYSDIITSVKHPAYKKISANFGNSVTNDVGLLKTTPIKLSQYGKLSAVEYPSLVGQAAVAMGYGLMQQGELVGSTLALGRTLQALDVVIKSCMKDLLRRSRSPIICISRKCRQPSSLCPGDSGGPLVHFSGVVGVNHMAHAPDCSLQYAKAGVSSNLVGIITPIGPYVEWITDQIRANVSVTQSHTQ